MYYIVCFREVILGIFVMNYEYSGNKVLIEVVEFIVSFSIYELVVNILI